MSVKAADIPDHEPLMVVAATCDYGWEFKAADGCYWPEDRDSPDMAAHGWIPDHTVTSCNWWPDAPGGGPYRNVRRWVRYETYTHGGPPSGGIGATRWGIGHELWEYPEKVLLAKLKSLVRRGLLDGCACGCRGDFTITKKGRAVLAEAS